MAGIIWDYYLLELVVIYKLFCKDQIGELRHDSNHHPGILQIPEEGNTLVHLCVMHYYFLFIILTRDQSQRHIFGLL